MGKKPTVWHVEADRGPKPSDETWDISSATDCVIWEWTAQMRWHFAVLMKQGSLGSRGAMPSAEDGVLEMAQHFSKTLSCGHMTPAGWY